MKRAFFNTCLGLCVALAFMACEEEHISTLPTFKGFRLEPTVWHSGDSITVTAVQQTPGDLLYKAVYKWSVACTDTTFTKTYSVVYDADKSDPFIGFRIPEDLTGKANINFSVEYSYSATPPTTIVNGSNDDTEGIFGRIVVRNNSALYGGCGGSWNTEIYPKVNEEE